MPRAPAGLHCTIPALPVADVAAATVRYRDAFGVAVPHAEDGFAIVVRDVAALFAELAPHGVLHPVSVDGLGRTDFGTREFAATDLDGNLLTFFARVPPA